MHSESQSENKSGVGAGSAPEETRPFVYCNCGCGASVYKNNHGYQGKWVLGHQVSKRTDQEWSDKFDEARSKATLCGCGCGEKTQLKKGKTLEQFIESGGAKASCEFKFGHSRRGAQWDYKITQLQRMAILGTLLGDSSISRPHATSNAPRICGNHGGPQEMWAKHKAKILSGLNCKVVEAENKGYGSIHWRYTTGCSESLIEIESIVKPSGNKKEISIEWLNQIGDIGFAWWVCDDGSCSGRGASLHTEGFSDKEQETIASWISEKYGNANVVSGGKGYKKIYLSANAQRALLPIIEHHIPESMQYKLDSYRLCSQNDKRRKSL